MKSLKTVHFAPSNDVFKAAIAERAVRSVKDVLYKTLTATLSLRYIDTLQDIAKFINSRKNRSIGVAPKDVNHQNIYSVWKYIQRHRYKVKKQSKNKLNNVKPDDYVRISKNKTIMEKNFLPNWSDEIFKVVKSVPRKKRVHFLEDYKGEKVEGCFYEPEIQKIVKSDETLYRVDKILGKRKRRGINELFVSWVGYSDKHNSWIKETDLVE